MSSSILNKLGSESIIVLSNLRMDGIVLSVFKGLNSLIVRSEDVLLAEPDTIDHIEDTTTTKSSQFQGSRSYELSSITKPIAMILKIASSRNITVK